MPLNRTRATLKLPLPIRSLCTAILCSVLAIGFAACSDSGGDASDEGSGGGGRGYNLAQDLAKGSELESRLVVDGELKLKNSDLGLLMAMAELDGFPLSIENNEILRCIEHDGRKPVKLELIQTVSRVALPEVLNFIKSPLLDQPVILTLESRNNWTAQKKGTRLVSSEEEEELALLAALSSMENRLWPDKRLDIDQEWDSGNVRSKDVPGFADVTAHATVQVIGGTNKGGKEYAKIERFTTYNAASKGNSGDFIKKIDLELKTETKLLFDVESRFITAETGKGLLKYEITLLDDDGEEIFVVVEGPLRIEYKATLRTSTNPPAEDFD